MSERYTALRNIGMLLFAACLLAASPAIRAQSYPAKSVRVIVPFEAGGGSDIAARQITTRLSEDFKRPFLVENRGGAGGLIGIEMTAKAPPDGYTLMIMSASFSATSATNKPAFDPMNTIIAVAEIGFSPFVLVTSPGLPAKTVAELIALAREKDGRLNYASAGVGSNTHLSLELFANMAKIKMSHVPYKGVAPSLTDLMNGQIDITLASYSSIEGHIKNGRMRALAITSARRVPSLPAMPVVAETLPGYEIDLWFGVMAPRGTPAPIVEQLNASINKILQSADTRKSLEPLGIVPTGGTPQHFADRMRIDYERWLRVIKESNIKTD